MLRYLSTDAPGATSKRATGSVEEFRLASNFGPGGVVYLPRRVVPFCLKDAMKPRPEKREQMLGAHDGLMYLFKRARAPCRATKLHHQCANLSRSFPSVSLGALSSSTAFHGVVNPSEVVLYTVYTRCRTCNSSSHMLRLPRRPFDQLHHAVKFVILLICENILNFASFSFVCVYKF